ncbi:hypothetical protein [Shewanella kaireitica]|uniref:hypothetical protein n=1 Tax=Shewanella kaireitica TaxID=212021 RepID=UPI00200DB295|nr:hypothetical protein [Shewanella kaireitica]MCL1095010.1 hypothetical protein [Shewanella kaireitica]
MKYLGILVLLFAASKINAETFSFIGSPVSVVKSEHPCEYFLSASDKEIVCMNVAFILNYEVVEWYGESIPKEEVQFVGFNHFTGLPKYTAFSYALVTLERRNEKLILKGIKPVVNVDSDDDYICVKERTMIADECTETQEVKEYLSIIEI